MKLLHGKQQQNQELNPCSIFLDTFLTLKSSKNVLIHHIRNLCNVRYIAPLFIDAFSEIQGVPESSGRGVGTPNNRSLLTRFTQKKMF